MDISTLQYMQDKVKRGEALQAAIRELKNDVKLLEVTFPGMKIVAVPISDYANSRSIFTVLTTTGLHAKLAPVIIAEIKKIIAELEAEFAAL